MIDDDDTMYVRYGNTTLYVAQLAADGGHEVRSEVVFKTPSDVGVLEGSRFYKVNGNYYIFAIRLAVGEYVLRSTKGPFGPDEMHKLLRRTTGPGPGGGVPHQGGIVRAPSEPFVTGTAWQFFMGLSLRHLPPWNAGARLDG